MTYRMTVDLLRDVLRGSDELSARAIRAPPSCSRWRNSIDEAEIEQRQRPQDTTGSVFRVDGGVGG